MTKNRLTHRQIKRQKKIQAERLSRAEEGHSLEQPGLLVAHYGTTLIVENASGQLFQCKLRQNLGTLVTGDNVIWQPIDEHTGIVVACKERHSVITKPYKHTTKPVVANVDRMIVVLALTPIPQATTLDRYLVVAHHLQLPVTIVINKWDLFSSPQHDALAARIEAYAQLGYPFIKVSNKTKVGLDELRAQLNHNTSILVGQSGVGKSSLLTTLLPDAKATIQTLSHNERLGRQTTTATRLYHLPEGGNIIDSPGIHQFKVLHLSKADILESYTEFAPFLGRCQFRNCEHQSEPGCALLTAIKNQQIPAFRLENYHALLADRTEK
ncbi:ribosome small subunit-dependent GTPase A [Candidatus Berkiella aquae]|uniref:Small ribosomal subunit biogenesis GTPase RsgA n=1 Tax=Candidatus Berkiella aquae TaxID=295108 RepID=A0A0Q9YIY8_9GAMM|nr:ribosome small subunit-dependent GTPase A [Candidatus Berkiella aquae]MCS5710165.1 ribosome small subunit-dependent GTPase A [Candidatus Berkiella aquae]